MPGVTGAEWQKLRLVVLARDGRTCHYCGGWANTVDHVVPKAYGGTDALDNLVAACMRCNSRRSPGTWNRRRALRARQAAAATRREPTGALVDLGLMPPR